MAPIAAVRRSARLQRLSSESTLSSDSEGLHPPVAARRSARKVAQLRPTSIAWTRKRQKGKKTQKKQKQKQNRVSKATKDTAETARSTRAATVLSRWMTKDSKSSGVVTETPLYERAQESCRDEAEAEADAEPALSGNRDEKCGYCTPGRSPSRCFHVRGNPLAQVGMPSPHTESALPSVERDGSQLDTNDYDSGYYSTKPADQRQVPQVLLDAFLDRDANTRRMMHDYASDESDDGYACDESMLDADLADDETLAGSPEYTWGDETGYFEQLAEKVGQETSWGASQNATQNAQNAGWGAGQKTSRSVSQNTHVFGRSSWVKSLESENCREDDPVTHSGNAAAESSHRSDQAGAFPWSSTANSDSDIWAEYYDSMRRNNSNTPARPQPLQDFSLRNDDRPTDKSLAEPSEYWSTNMDSHYNPQLLDTKGEGKQMEAPVPQVADAGDTDRTDDNEGQDYSRYFVSGFIPRPYVM